MLEKMPAMHLRPGFILRAPYKPYCWGKAKARKECSRTLRGLARMETTCSTSCCFSSHT